MLDFSCSKCGSEYHADEGHEGKQIRCGKCGAIVIVSRTRGQLLHAKPVSAAGSESPVKPTAGEAFSEEWKPSHLTRRRTDKLILLSGLALAAVAAIMAVAYFEGHGSSRNLTVDHYPANSLPTGTRIIPEEATSGHGELEANNGTAQDACLIVVNAATHHSVRGVYVKAHGTYTLDHLDPGRYLVVFATGVDWDSDAKRFNRSASYSEFDGVFSFQESREAGRIEYDRQEITLNPVLGGNVSTTQLSEPEFRNVAGLGVGN